MGRVPALRACYGRVAKGERREPDGARKPRALVDEGNDEAGKGTENVTYFCK